MNNEFIMLLLMWMTSGFFLTVSVIQIQYDRYMRSKQRLCDSCEQLLKRNGKYYVCRHECYGACRTYCPDYCADYKPRNTDNNK